MRNKTIIILIIVIAGLLAALYLMGYLPFGNEPEDMNNEGFSIKSDDESAELFIPKDALPDNVDPDDISVTKVSNDLTENGTWVVYDLEPDGLVFAAPILLNITLESVNNSVPLIFVSSSTGVDLANNTFTEFDLENHTQTVSIPLTHFSTINVYNSGTISLKLSAPDEVFVGDIIKTIASFTLGSSRTLLYWNDTGSGITVAEFLEPPHVIYKGAWKNPGTINNFTPDGYFGDKPRSTQVDFGQTNSVQDYTFISDKPGRGRLYYEVEVTVDLVFFHYNSESDYLEDKFDNQVTLRNKKFMLVNHVLILCSTPRLIVQGIYTTQHQNNPEIHMVVKIVGPANATGFVTLTGSNMEPMIQQVLIGPSGSTRNTFIHPFSGEITVFVEVGELNASRKRIFD